MPSKSAHSLEPWDKERNWTAQKLRCKNKCRGKKNQKQKPQSKQPNTIKMNYLTHPHFSQNSFLQVLFRAKQTLIFLLHRYSWTYYNSQDFLYTDKWQVFWKHTCIWSIESIIIIMLPWWRAESFSSQRGNSSRSLAGSKVRGDTNHECCISCRITNIHNKLYLRNQLG